MNNKEYIAYVGKGFQIEWYYSSISRSRARQYYNSLSVQERIQLLKLFKRLGDSGEIKDKTKFRYEGHQIYTFKPQPNRFLCFFFGKKKVIVTNGFKKKQNKFPKIEKEKAMTLRKDYIQRVQKGNYYE